MSAIDIGFPLLLLWALWLLQATWCAFNVFAFGRRIQRLDGRYRRRIRAAGPYTPRALIVVPVKGRHPGLERHLAAMCTQDYPDYRIQYVVECRDDPAYAVLTAGGADVAIAGRAERGGQKVQNLRTGLAGLRDSDEVVVFADADGMASRQWLRRLVDPLRRTSVGAVTGYRWLFPGAGLAAAAMAVVNGSVATLTGASWRTFAWGGAVALRRDTIGEARLSAFWDGALSDDFQLTAAIKATGKNVLFLPRCMVASPVAASWRQFWEFGRRQYLIARIHVSWIWWVALLATGLYTLAFSSVVATQFVGGTAAEAGRWAFGAVFLLDALRGTLRNRVVGQLFGAEGIRAWRSALWLELIFTPLWMTLHFLIVLSSAGGRCISWAGIDYRLRGPQDVEILGRRR